MSAFRIHCIISGKETGNRISVFEETVAPGAGPPRHCHNSQLEIFHVLSGTLLFEVDGTRKEIHAGGSVAVPAGTPHAFTNPTKEDTLIHFELLPSGNAEEGFAKLTSGQVEDIEQFFTDHDMQLLGPPIG